VVRDVENEEQAKRLAVEQAAQPFAIDRGPLIRVCVLRWRPDEQIVIVVMHHLVSDRQSLNLLWDEATQIYAAYQNGGRADLPELSLQYGDWAALQRRNLASDCAARSLAFWTEKLAAPPAVLEFPGARRRPSRPGFRGKWECIQLSASVSEAVHRLAAEERSTPFAVFLSVFLVLLRRSTGSADLCIGIPVSARRDREAETLIGLFANTLALRFRPEGEPTFRESLRHVRDTCLESFEHSGTPLEDIIEALRIERNPAVSPLFQMAFLCETFRERSRRSVWRWTMAAPSST
jgi:hypothetical protein